MDQFTKKKYITIIYVIQTKILQYNHKNRKELRPTTLIGTTNNHPLFSVVTATIHFLRLFIRSTLVLFFCAKSSILPGIGVSDIQK